MPDSYDLDLFFADITKLFNPEQVKLITQSQSAFVASESNFYEQTKLARALNGEVVTESDCETSDSTSDDPTDLTTERIRNLVSKKRRAIKRRARYLRAKTVAKKRLLVKKISKRTSKILNDCPDMGKVIEAYVQESNIGAVAWRRTGVLTFDGNSKLKQKATYEGIRRHLESVYGRKFSYGSVVELCIPVTTQMRSNANAI